MANPSTDPFLPTSTFTTPQGHTYHYIYAQPPQTSPPKSTILILHGFPSTPHDFHLQILHLLSHNHAILAPYLLGYHPTSTPKDAKAYRLKLMCNDLVALCEHLNLLPLNNSNTVTLNTNTNTNTNIITTASNNNDEADKSGRPPPIHALAHDWGSTLLSRLTYYHPTLVTHQIYLSIGPTPLGSPFDLETVNSMTKKYLGYEAYGYQTFFIDGVNPPVRAAGILERHHERMEELMFVAEGGVGGGVGNGDRDGVDGDNGVNGEHLWREYFARVGGLERWLTGSSSNLGTQTRMIRGVTEASLQKRRETFVPTTTGLDIQEGQDDSSDQGEFGAGYGGPLMWYVGLNTNINVEDEKDFREDWDEYKTDNTVLLVLTSKDPTVNPDLQMDMTKAHLLNPEQQLSTKTLNSGHFVMLEQPDELNALILDFFQDTKQ